MTNVCFINSPSVCAHFSLGGNGLGVCKHLRISLQMGRTRRRAQSNVIRFMRPVNLQTPRHGGRPNR